MDLVDEQHFARVERGQEGGEVSRRPQLRGDHVGEAGLAHAGRAEEEDVVQGLPAAARRFDGHPQVGHHVGLTDVFVEGPRPQRLVEAGVVVGRPPGNDALFH